MICKLPVWYKGTDLYKSVELKKPSGRVISDTHDNMKTQNAYIAMRNFIAGCTVKIIGENGEITDELAIKRTYDLMSNKNLEYLSQQLLIWYLGDEDYIEGVYNCPRCNTRQISEKKDIDGIETDTRDRISELKVGFMESEDQLNIHVDFDSQVDITSENQTDSIKSIDMGFPSTESYVQAEESIGRAKELQVQYEAWARSIVKVDGQPVDKQWIRTKGRALFNAITEKSDFNKITNAINKFGIDPHVDKTCKECGKEWRPIIPTFNFFVSALG